MKKIALFLISLLIISMSPAGIAQAFEEEVQLNSPKTLTVIIPNDKSVDPSMITQIKFEPAGNCWAGATVTNNSFTVETRRGNQYVGSGVIYTVNFSVENGNNNTVVKFQPIKYKKYQEEKFFRNGPAIPDFPVQDVIDYIVKQPVHYTLEMDSPYNTDAVYSNFVRLVKQAHFYEGELDPITGKTFKDKFVIPYKDKQIYFTLDIYPYQSGSKVMLHLVVPGTITSDNVVDFGVILKDLKAQLEDVAEVQKPKASTAKGSIEDKLAELKALLQKGVITQQEYDAKRKQLIDQL